jgi:hypothetical protein
MDKQQALERVKALKNYYMHLGTFVVVNIFLFFLDISDGSADWFYWVLFGWGLGLISHTVSMFAFTKSWEDKKVQQLTKKNYSKNQTKL